MLGQQYPADRRKMPNLPSAEISGRASALPNVDLVRQSPTVALHETYYLIA